MSAAKKIRVLVVDDEESFREILQFSLERRGYEVVTAANGREAFETLSQNPVDVVISDICMPGGDGVELLERTRTERPETPIILLVTGFTDLTTEEAHNKGAEALFSKPLDGKILQDTIDRLMKPIEERWMRSAPDSEGKLEVELRFEGLAEALKSSAINLGRGGMFVGLKPNQLPNANKAVDFKISFDRSSSLEGSGIVRWVRVTERPNLTPGCGIEFTYLSEPERQKVIDYVNAHKPTPFIPKR